jgi:hypothetical protein
MVSVFLIPTKDTVMVLMLSIVRVYVDFRVKFLKMLCICKAQLLSLLPYCVILDSGHLQKRVLL